MFLTWSVVTFYFGLLIVIVFSKTTLENLDRDEQKEARVAGW